MPLTDEEKKIKRAEYQKEYREKNKEKAREYIKIYRKENKTKIKQQLQDYRERNKEKLLEYEKQYREQNSDKIKEYREINKEQLNYKKRDYSQTPTAKKTRRISHWKDRGVISNDFNELYEAYLSQTNCDECNIELTYDNVRTRTTKCLDHNHETGEFRNILCNSCNVRRK